MLFVVSNNWSSMNPEGFIQYVGVTLLVLMVWLVKRLINNHQDMLKDMKEQAARDRALMLEENRFVREDHQKDMQALFSDSKENRKTFESGFKEVAAAIRALSSEIHKK